MSFIDEYFIDPIRYGTGYNVVNTLTYAVILIAAALLTLRLLRRLRVTVDQRFFFGIVPFIVLGATLRALEDLYEAAGANATLLESPLQPFMLVDAFGTVRNLLLVTPVIYFTLFFVALGALLAALALQRERYHTTWFTIGVFLNVLVASQYRFANATGMLMILALAGTWAIGFLSVRHVALQKKITRLAAFLTPQNVFILSAHMLDASSTFIALQYYGYFEQHVLPGFVISLFGPASFFLLKLPVVLLVLHYLDKELHKKEDAEKKTFLKIAILVLGLAPGLRDFLRLGMGV